MTSSTKPKVFGTGLIALDLVVGLNADDAIRSWAGGTCGNVLLILAYLGWDSYPIARMNGDDASEKVRADMKRWGVRLDFASCGPTTNTPIIVEHIRQGRNGPVHRFSFSCPKCGHHLPSYRPITTDAVGTVERALQGASVFFLDRLSRAALTLASQAATAGAVVVFEPSGKGDERLFAEAMQIAHVVKYAEQRLAMVDAGREHMKAIVEIQTMGEGGLRFRHRLQRRASEWVTMESLQAANVVDTCGAGDWCTAGLLSRIAVGGYEGLRRARVSELKDALRFGQALAAWNCGYEGARGGMYATDRRAFTRQIESIIAGRPEAANPPVEAAKTDGGVRCPSCPPLGGKPRGRTPTSRTTSSQL